MNVPFADRWVMGPYTSEWGLGADLVHDRTAALKEAAGRNARRQALERLRQELGV